MKLNISTVYTALRRLQRTNSREIHTLYVAHQAERCEHEQMMKMTCTFFVMFQEIRQIFLEYSVKKRPEVNIKT